MRKFALLLVAAVFSISLQAGMLYVPAHMAASKHVAVKGLEQIDVQNVLSLTPSKVQEMTGKKMSLKEKIALKFTQAKLKKEFKKGGSGSIPKGLYIVLAIFGWAWLAMGIMDDFSGQNWWLNLILTFLFWIPGFIHALIVMKQYY
ncbi:MAG: YqaE/Pmp3 family membrane protein [Lacibacter sp.]|jgi:uncharacterized membrane protein YqaE (UPF0057 family)